MPHYTPLPPSAMRVLRPLGLAALALFLAFPLAMLAGVVAGPFDRDTMQWLVPVLGAVAFVPLMLLSRARRARAAERARVGEAGPMPGGSVLVAGVLAVALGMSMLLMALAGSASGPGPIGSGLMLCSVGVGGIGVGFRRVLARRAWRASRRR
ncbi:hypothetical protein [Xanthomonas sp. XNM01]|uniref:hypothetical protein n=1 Tax=Xanthomonas sp. XNM01 TaxID=2769289 RepID=UPI00177ED95F|nr:hypothetical protein [Xanthomonas sp. XNM01]MBD9368531.1 hypothetical protein [Xanthomonas sp. XNM01]